MIIDQATYTGGVRMSCFDLSDSLGELRAQGAPTDFLWIGLNDPTPEEFAKVNAELNLHPLAVEDVLRGRQRAKIERFDETTFVVLKTLRYVDETSDVETGEIMVFVGDQFVVTVRNGPLNPLAGLRAHLESRTDLLELGPMAVLHAVMDMVVDDYRAVDGELALDLDEMEARVFSNDNRPISGDLYLLKREVLEAKRATLPLLSALEMFVLNPRSPVPEGELRHLFRDVADHLKGVCEHVESYDRLLSDILSAHQSQTAVEQTEIAVRQNNDMRKISAWVAIAAVPTMIAGVYGMNFDNMPELRWTWGYPAVLAFMASVCIGLYRGFRRSGWL